jgi:nitrile hydratase accessory protein
LSQPASLARFAADERLPRDEEGPVFEEAWQAEVALTVRLHEAGCFTWNEWAATLGAVLMEVRDRGKLDDGSHYYDHSLASCIGAPGHREAGGEHVRPRPA